MLGFWVLLTGQEKILSNRKLEGSTDTPGSVPFGDGHLSSNSVTTVIKRSTRGLERAALKRPLSDLAPSEVYLAVSVT